MYFVFANYFDETHRLVNGMTYKLILMALQQHSFLITLFCFPCIWYFTLILLLYSPEYFSSTARWEHVVNGSF